MVVYSDELCHYGIRGMRWGIRRYQNPDGTLTEAGRKRISKLHDSNSRLIGRRDKLTKRMEFQTRKYANSISKANQKAAELRVKEYGLFTTKTRADKLEYKASKLEARAAQKAMRIDRTKARIAKIDALVSKNNRKISELNSAEISKGKAYTEKMTKAYDYFAKNGGSFYKSTLSDPYSVRDAMNDFALHDPEFRKIYRS